MILTKFYVFFKRCLFVFSNFVILLKFYDFDDFLKKLRSFRVICRIFLIFSE